jgi:RNA polymerase sigma-70 factor (ECF subfamily)
MGDVERLQGWEARAEPLPRTFDAFYEDEHDRLFRALCVITGSRAEAEDLTQEAFTRVLERWDRVATMDEPVGYLHRTAMNLFRSQYRRLRRLRRRSLDPGSTPDVFGSIEDRDVAVQALATLTPRQRAALVLTEGLDYSGEDAARLMGIRTSTVYALTHQARAALQRREEVDDG